MKLFAQHGYGDGQKVAEGLQGQLLDGVIFSPKDIKLAKMQETAASFASSFPGADRLFDPQFYAALPAVDPLCRVGNLDDDYADYFQARRRVQLLGEQQVISDVRTTLT